MVPLEIQWVDAQTLAESGEDPLAALTTEPEFDEPIPIRIDGQAIWFNAAIWCLVIVGMVEGMKRLHIWRVKRKTAAYKRTIPVYVIVSGLISAPTFGPLTLAPFGYIIDPWQALWFGLPAGFTAAGIYVVLKRLVWPAILLIAQVVTSMIPQLVRGFIKGWAKTAGFVPESEVSGERPSVDDEDPPE